MSCILVTEVDIVLVGAKASGRTNCELLGESENAQEVGQILLLRFAEANLEAAVVEVHNFPNRFRGSI